MKKEYIFCGEKKEIIKSCNGDYYDSFSFAGKPYALHFNAINSFGARARFVSKIINGMKKAAYITIILLILNIIMPEYVKAFTNNVAAGSSVTGEIVSGGTQEVFGTANNTTINGGGEQNVRNYGIVNNTIVNDDGIQIVGHDGTAKDTTVNSGGLQFVAASGKAENTTVRAGGSQTVFDGSAFGIKQLEGGNINATVGTGLYMGTYVSGTNALGQTFTLKDGVADNFILYQNGSQTVAYGGVSNMTILNSGGVQKVQDQGEANNTTINTGGVQTLNLGARANNTVNNGGTLNAFSGSFIKNYDAKDGKINMYGDNTLSGNTNLIGGALNIMNSGSFNTINIENLQSDNAVINMNVDMEKHTGDLLKISGSYNGSSLIKLKNIAPIFTQTSGDGLKLVEIANTATGSGTFALAGGKWDAGGYEYMLYRGTENAVGNDWYLRSSNSFSDVFKTMINIPLLNSVLAETGMNSLQKRLGDLRNMGSGDNGIWARTHYKSITIDELQKTDMRMFGVEAGYDRLVTPGE
ncbi:MAG: AIDA repeat-containing protein, partial [Elusimicrobiota bacterium]|nr:AIDA repeat-containing protein [Elusimicrobiota bacterium]